MAASLMQVQLRDVIDADLETLCKFQLDAAGNEMAKTIPRQPQAFFMHWRKAIRDPAVTAKSIMVDDALAGWICCFACEGLDSLGYWIGRPFWGRSVATNAVKAFLTEFPVRPLHARVAVTNVASLRVLEKCGFTIVGQEHSAASDRYQECEESMLTLT